MIGFHWKPRMIPGGRIGATETPAYRSNGNSAERLDPFRVLQRDLAGPSLGQKETNSARNHSVNDIHGPNAGARNIRLKSRTLSPSD
jgi:hypothetical protein